MSTPLPNEKRSTRRKPLLDKAASEKSVKTPKSGTGRKVKNGSTTKPKLPRSDSPYLPRLPKTESVKLEIKTEVVSPVKAQLKVINPEIKLSDDTPLSALDELFSTSSGSINDSQSTSKDTSVPELNSDELEDDSLAPISIPDGVRKEAGSSWRLKEALLNSFHFGKATLRATEFARSKSEIKTAEVLADISHSLESKKFYVKLHLGMFI